MVLSPLPNWLKEIIEVEGEKMKREVSLLKGAAAGLVAGFVASWVMNQFQAKLGESLSGRHKSHGAQSEQSGTPEAGVGEFLKKRGAEDSEDNAAERTANFLSVAAFNKPLSKGEKDLGGTIFHYAFGAGTGALYGAASEVVPFVRTGLGLPFGLGVWAVADEFVVPALGLSKSPSEYSASIHGYALSSHLVYGLATELTHRLTRRALSTREVF